MIQDSADIQSLDELRQFVHRKLCEKENLLEDQSRLRETLLVRGEQPCGLQFFVHGPRLVRLGAIWAADRNLLYFYDARGERYDKVDLKHRIPLPESVPARAAS